MPYTSPYANSIASLVSNQGAIRAAAIMAQADATARSMGSIAQAGQGIASLIAEAPMRKLQMQSMSLDVQGKERALAANKQMDDAYAEWAKNGFDEKVLLAKMPGHLIPGVQKSLVDVKKANADLAEAEQKVEMGKADLGAGLMNGVKASGYEPSIFLAAVKTARDKKFISPEEATQHAIGAIEQGPAYVKQATDDYLNRSEKWAKVRAEQEAAHARTIAAGKPTEPSLAFDAANPESPTAVRSKTALESLGKTQPLEPIIGPNGATIYATRSDAVGKPVPRHGAEVETTRRTAEVWQANEREKLEDRKRKSGQEVFDPSSGTWAKAPVLSADQYRAELQRIGAGYTAILGGEPPPTAVAAPAAPAPVPAAPTPAATPAAATGAGKVPKAVFEEIVNKYGRKAGTYKLTDGSYWKVDDAGGVEPFVPTRVPYTPPKEGEVEIHLEDGSVARFPNAKARDKWLRDNGLSLKSGEK